MSEKQKFPSSSEPDDNNNKNFLELVNANRDVMSKIRSGELTSGGLVIPADAPESTKGELINAALQGLLERSPMGFDDHGRFVTRAYFPTEHGGKGDPVYIGQDPVSHLTEVTTQKPAETYPNPPVVDLTSK